MFVAVLTTSAEYIEQKSNGCRPLELFKIHVAGVLYAYVLVSLAYSLWVG